ncbi:sister chromatid cohesion protein PDS5 homolog C isoform X2 [Nymphaea colorata]|uniref:sister chromatid cohesion protein PDS5 homolog C isoform X2 n=1 Tax=Nymphaea colorata TaxID=210225 RepID=UPI00214E3267|nr:sister chromatid cohesion protein PDS5 homolog C isoform X2 [Nymphaea colorata]
MASAVEKDLEEQLVEAGNKLRKPPAELDELRCLLEVLENCLGRVEQSPSTSMSTALCPSMKSLVTPALLRHSDKDVRLSVATCLSEITRITAPDAPYDDELMKEIFQMIVATFEDLSETSTPSFAKRVLILETVAKVRSCVVMLDLECDDLIVEMFRHFCKAIREDHAECVFTSMEAIMTVVLEESEDIQLELINVLLDKLKVDNQETLSIAGRLVEKVMNSCAAKLKPYLVEALNSTGASMNDYSKIVAQICEGPAKDIHQPEKDESKALENAGSVENTQKAVEVDEENARCGAAEDAETSAKSKLSNGSLTSAKEDSSKDDKSQKRKSSHVSIKKVAPDSTEVAPEHPDQQDSKSEAMSKHATKRTKARKPSFSKSSNNASNDSRKIPEEKAVEQPKIKKRRMKENERLPSEGPSVKETKAAAESGKETSVTTMHSPTQNDAGPRKKVRGKSAQKEDAKAESEMPTLPRQDVGTLSGDSSKEQSSDVKVSKSEKELERRKSSEVKSSQRSSKKADSLNDDEGTSTKKRRGRKSKDLKEKVDDHRRTGDSSNKKSSVGKKSADVTPKDGKIHAKGSSVKKASGRKRDEASGSTGRAISYDESLVGSKIKVWWPLDKMFYEGSVVSYDPSKKKHKVSYADGDQEELLLSKERWTFVQAEEKEGHSASDDSDDALAVTPPPKKKMRTSESSSRGKQVKVETPLRKRKDTPAMKSRGSTSKSATKSQPNGSSVRGKSGSGKAQQGSDIKGKNRQRRSRG